MPSDTVIPSYKGQASEVPQNRDFNWCVAKSRVRNEHRIGINKLRWASLQCLRLALNEKDDMTQILRWIQVCIILNNMLGDFGNAWNDMYDGLPPQDSQTERDLGPQAEDLENDAAVMEWGRARREKVRDYAVAFNWESDGLPITATHV